MRLKLIFITFLITVVYADDDPLIEISDGWVLGTLEKSYNGRTFSSFEGIPYARPPIGELRFEPPKETHAWTGTLVANTKHTCVQSTPGELTVSGDEDCLYLNVYVPRTMPSKSEKLNVIVHIHGGGFVMMSAHTYAGPKYLMDEDVILVTMNYRLGPFGFLSTEDDLVPGNNGLKDQVLALKWIQKNIKYFGGNPNSVTLTGMSAGGASVHLHYFSPLSKGLFHRGVSQSGTALNPWAIQEAALDNAKRLAKLIGCPSTASAVIMECLRLKTANEIYEGVGKLSVIDGIGKMVFGPIIERDHEEAFLTTQPLLMLKNKLVSDVPWVVSVAQEEGSFAAAFLKKELSEIYDKFDEIAPHLLIYDYINEDAEKVTISNKIKQYYLKSASRKNFVTLLGDRMFVAGAHISSKLQAKVNKSPVYFYMFAYKGQHSFAEYLVNDTANIGPSHGDDALYYLSNAVSEEVLSKSDEKMKSIFLEWLIAYADNQEPKLNGVTWKPVTGDETHNLLYILNPDDINMETAADLGSSNFWSTLPLSENDNVFVIRDEL